MGILKPLFYKRVSNLNRYKLSLRLYQVLILLLTPLLVLIFLLRSINHKEYRQRMRERFGWVSSNMQPGGIIVHAASVGEVIAIKPFVEGLLLRFPELPITVTTFTPTGSAQVVKSFHNRVQHCYLPLDISFCVHLFYKLMRPQAMVLMETEIWPTIIQRCYKSNIPLVLINARLSEKSLAHYQKLTWLITPALNKLSAIMCQSQDNAEHFMRLGANSDKVSVSGNLKYDIDITDSLREKIAELSQFVDTKQRKVLVLGSSHQGEEDVALVAYRTLKERFNDLLLIIVPRHPERFDGVAQLVLKQQLNLVRRSESKPVTTDDDVWLIDSLGELVACYAISDISIIAGSFSDVGGHNPLEAAVFAKPIVVGPNMANFKDMNQKLVDGRGIIQLDHNEELSNTLFNLLLDEQLISDIGKNAEQVILENQGATQLSIDTLANSLTH